MEDTFLSKLKELMDHASFGSKSREGALVVTKLQEAKFWYEEKQRIAYEQPVKEYNAPPPKHTGQDVDLGPVNNPI